MERGMRRSARQKIQAEVFSPSGGTTKKYANYKDISDSEDGGSEFVSSPKVQKGDVARRRPSVHPSRAAKVDDSLSPTKVAVSSPGRRGVGQPALAGNLLFSLLKKPTIREENADAWVTLFRSDRVAAIADLVNFVLACAGSNKNWVARDVDLEALEPEEIDELLAGMIKNMQETDGSKFYPISMNSKSKEHKTCRQRFVRFWELLVTRVLSKLDEAQFRAVDMLRFVVDQLVSLSSMIIMNVRDVVTEASMTIGRVVTVTLAELKKQRDTATRQLSAENLKTTDKKSKKFSAVSKEKTAIDRHIEGLTALVENIFTSIFIHRHKDTHVEIRANCASSFGDWAVADIDFFCQDEYLKYIGWMCSDRSELVRKQAIRAIQKIVEKANESEALQSFVEHFIDRFVEIAAGDIDGEISLEMITALRAMQNQGLIDFVPEQQLDLVDKVVFDEQASSRVRQEAFLFMMDHTRGFQEDEDEKDVKVETSKFSKRTQSADVSIERRRKVAMQLETIAEFIEHHTGSDFANFTKVLTDTGLSLDRINGTFLSWSSVIALLLREGDEVTATSLTDVQSSILLRIFAHCACSIKDSIGPSEQIDVTTQKPGLKRSTQLTAKSEEYLEDLSNQLVNCLPRLLVRFRDDEENLAILGDLFTCCDVSSSALHQKSLKSILNTISGLMASSQNETLIEKYSQALRHWIRLGGASLSQVESTVRDILETTISKMSETQKAIKEAVKSGGSRAKSSKKGSSSQNDYEKQDSLYGLSSSITLFKHLWRNIDCRGIIKDNLLDLSDTLVEASDVLLQACETESSKVDKDSSRLARATLSGLKHTANCLFNFIAWTTRDAHSNGSSYSEDDEVPTEIVETLTIREKLIDVIHTWLGLETSDDRSNLFVQELHRTAFEIVGDLRLIHSPKLGIHVHLCALVWTPSKEFLDDLRRVFETEETKIRALAASIRDQMEKLSGDPLKFSTAKQSMEDLGETLTDGLLRPLSQSMVYDSSSINRRQAAAILVHIMDPIESVQKYVKEWVRKLKENSISKYLEVQLVTLKAYFERKVVDIVANFNADENRNDEEAEDDINSALEEVCDLSRRLSQTMGVGKVKGDALEALGQFFLLGLEFAFADGVSVQVNFLRVLSSYFKLLQAEHLRTVSEYFEEHIEKHGIDIDDESAMVHRFDLSSVFQNMIEFKAALGGRKVTRQRAPQMNRSYASSTTSKPMIVAKGVKTLDELDFEATQDSMDFQKVPSSRARRAKLSTSTKSSSDFPALGLHLEDIDDDVDEEDDMEDFVPAKKSSSTKQTTRIRSASSGRGTKRNTISTLKTQDEDDDDDDDEIADWGKGHRRRIR